MQNKEQLRQRMRDIHNVLVTHDHKAGPEDGCLCLGLYEEMRGIWLVLNEHKSTYQPRAGPRPPAGSDEHPNVDLDNWTFLKQTEPDAD